MIEIIFTGIITVICIAVCIVISIACLVLSIAILPSILLMFLPSNWVFSKKHTKEYGRVYGFKNKQIHHWLSYSYPNLDKTYWFMNNLKGDPVEVEKKHKEFGHLFTN